jgi:tetratricopeptide (TPR) repeat protein
MSRFKRLLVETHQRSLWQALAVYAGASLGVLGTVDMFSENLGLPRWIFWLAFSLLVMGLPVVMAISLAKEEVYGDEVPAEHVEAAAAEDRRLRFLTWRTAGFAFVGMVAMWGVISTGWVLLGVPSYLLFTGAAAGFVEETDCIVVAEFENETESTRLGLVVRTLVVTDLGQTSYMGVLGVEQLSGTLRRMRLPDSTRVDQRLAREIALRENCPAVVAGTVVQLGPGYVLSARILEAATGEEVVPLSEPAVNEWALYEAAERLSRQVRRHLGESLASIQRSEPLENVTTSSLEALELYSRATGPLWARWDFATAGRLLLQAVELDTTFALAYRALALLGGGRPGGGRHYWELAWRFREHAPERDRVMIDAQPFWSPRGRLDSAAHVYEMAIERYPNPEWRWSNNLALLYYTMYRFEDALALWLKLLETEAGSSREWDRAREIAMAARAVGRHGLADSMLAIMRETIPPEQQQELTRTEAWNAYYAGDLVRVDSLAREMEKDPRLAYDGEGLRAVPLALYGRMEEALALAVPPWEWRVFIPLVYFVAGTPERALPYLDDFRSRLTLETGTRVPGRAYRNVAGVAKGYALAGDVQSARELLAVMDSQVENSDFNPWGMRENVHAVIALQEGRAEDAVEYFRRAKAAFYGRHTLWDHRSVRHAHPPLRSPQVTEREIRGVAPAGPRASGLALPRGRRHGFRCPAP